MITSWPSIVEGKICGPLGYWRCPSLDVGMERQDQGISSTSSVAAKHWGSWLHLGHIQVVDKRWRRATEYGGMTRGMDRQLLVRGDKVSMCAPSYFPQASAAIEIHCDMIRQLSRLSSWGQVCLVLFFIITQLVMHRCEILADTITDVKCYGR